MDKLLIIDGHNLLFRMFYGIPSSIKNTKGKEIKGSVGFISSLNKLIKKLSPDKIIIAFDSITSITKNLEQYSDYKQNRIDYSQLPEEENPFTQLSYIYKALDCLKINYIEAKDYEADDYIASLCEMYKKEYDITIVSTDNDFLQLVEEHVTVYHPRGSEGVFYTSNKVYEKYGIMPNQVIEYKSIVGDSSDNIKGIYRVGPKTALKILNAGNIDDILNKKVEIDEKLYNKLNDNKDILDRNKILITMKKDININNIKLSSVSNMNTSKRAIDVLRECEVY